MSADEIAAGIETLVSEFRRLGLAWRLTKGTVFAEDSNTPTLTLVVLDGDVDPSLCISMVGQVAQGARVYVMNIPPQGNYIVGIGSGGMRLWQSELAQASGIINLTTTPTVSTGATITLTVPPGAVYEAEIVCDFEKIGTNTATTGIGQLYLDAAVAGTQQATYRATSAVAGDRATTTQHYGPTPVDAGSHTWDIRGSRAGGADTTLRLDNLHTNLRVHIYT